MLHEVKFQSFNERDEVHAWIYVPAAKPKGIVQVIHGFGEHSRMWGMARLPWRVIHGETGETRASIL